MNEDLATKGSESLNPTAKIEKFAPRPGVESWVWMGEPECAETQCALPACSARGHPMQALDASGGAAQRVVRDHNFLCLVRKSLGLRMGGYEGLRLESF